MKKIFTLFVAAMLGLCAYAQDPCPSRMEMHLLDGEDPANVTFEFYIAQNNSLNLNGFNLDVNMPFTMVNGEAVSVEYGDNGFKWKRVQGSSYVTAQGYAPYILERLEGLTDEEKENLLYDYLYNNSNAVGTSLRFIQILKTIDCRFYPNHAGKVGMGMMDMSKLADGEYTFVIENTPETGSFSYAGGPEGNRAWTFDEPVIMTLVKENGVVTEIINTPEPPVEYSEFYVVGTFNGWSQEDGMIQLEENADGTQYTGEVQLEDGAEFKVITPVEDGWKWFGGVDDNQVGYFEINDGLLNQPIELIDGANFKVVGEGNYTITVVQPATAEGKAVAEPLVMTVSKEATSISTIAADKVDNHIFDLQGRELQSVPEHGIYIQNGKKYVK